MRLLFRATNWVGDVVMSLPALRALRASFPGSRLEVLCRPWVADLYRLHREVDEVLVEDLVGEHAGRAGRERLAAQLRARRYDKAVILPTSFRTALTVFEAGIPERIGYRGEGRAFLLTHALSPPPASGEHQVLRHLRLAAAAGATLPSSADTSWPMSAAVRDSGVACLKGAGWDGSPFLAAHVASYAHAAKRWPLGRFAEALERIAARYGLSVVFLGSGAERPLNAEAASLARGARSLDLAGRSSLPEVIGVLQNAALFLGNDSGLAHLAAAAGRPTVVVFGPTDPEATRPWDGPRRDGREVRVAVARARPLCAPCLFRTCPIDHACMEGLTVDRVVSAVGAAMGNRAPDSSAG